MPKQIYCANCGMELSITQKAIPSQQKVISLLSPHTCPDESTTLPFTDPISNELVLKPSKPNSNSTLEALNKLKFVSKLNELPQSTPIAPTGDKRSPDLKRPDSNSSAPSGILNAVKSGSTAKD